MADTANQEELEVFIMNGVSTVEQPTRKGTGNQSRMQEPVGSYKGGGGGGGGAPRYTLGGGSL